MDSLRLYIIAGEPSGDALGAKLIKSLRKLNKHIEVMGIGGERMETEEIRSLFPISDIAIIGFTEVIPHIAKVYQRIDQTVEDILRFQPDAVITIDSPGFCCRVVKKLKERFFHTKFIHYVAPTVWAYKPERAKKFAELFDHLMVLLPFEPSYFEKEGLPCTFVGHSILEEPVNRGDGVSFRYRNDIPADAPLLCVLAGSRRGEIRQLMPSFTEAVRGLVDRIPNLHVVFPTIAMVSEQVREATHHLPVPTIVVEGQDSKYDAFAASNMALVKSGTASLEVAMARLPMVVAYRVNPISAWMMRRMMSVKHVNLVNILMDREVIPECLQERCDPRILADKIVKLYYDREYRERQLQNTQAALEKLRVGEGMTSSEKAAQTVLDILGQLPLVRQRSAAVIETV